VKETSALAMAAMTETRIRNFIFVFAWCCWLGKLESSQVTVILLCTSKVLYTKQKTIGGLE